MPGIIAKRVLEEIRARTDIAELIGSYFHLRRAGATFKALCPFHKEKTPSFTVNPQRQIFHCFGCGAGGDVFAFLMRQEGVDFGTAVRMLARRAGVVLEMEEGDASAAAEKERLYRVHEEIAQFYRRCLRETRGAAGARAYLDRRGLAGEAEEAFGIGYAPNRWDAALQWAGKHRYPVELLERAGLALRSDRPERGNAAYDRFRNRLMFPIRDEQGRVIAFSGRTLEAGANAGAKYVNSPETPLFNKGRTLYALDRARRAIVDAREAIVCEGQIDVIRCHLAGFTNAVAAQGTAFTPDHVRILKRYADGVILMFDSDNAGRSASIRTADAFIQGGMGVRIAAMPAGEDPDSFLLKQGADAFRGLLAAAESVVGFLLRDWNPVAGANAEAEVLRTARRVFELVLRSDNLIQQERMLHEAGGKLGVDIKPLFDEFRRQARRAPRARPVRSDADGSVSATPASGAAAVAVPAEERALCEHLVLAPERPELAALVDAYLPFKVLTHAWSREFVRACLAASRAGTAVQEALAEAGEPGGEFQSFAASVLAAPVKAKGSEFSVEDAVRGLMLRIWRRELQRRREALGPGEAERRNQLTYDLNALLTWEAGAPVIELESGA